jgi:hypothetical protein
MVYYNTTNLKGDELKKSQKKTISQESAIYDMFKKQIWMTPSDAYYEFDEKFPLTSIRRAFTNLTKRNKIEKTNEMGMGMYGKLEHCWKLK